LGIEGAKVFPAATSQRLPDDRSAVAKESIAHVDPLRGVDVGQTLSEAFARISDASLTGGC
jgi:hypothetical protein